MALPAQYFLHDLVTGRNSHNGSWQVCQALLQEIFPTQGSKPCLMSPALAGRFFTTSTTLEAPAVSRPWHMSQEMSVWPGLETFHHQGLSDVPVQRPKVMSPSHCQLDSAEQSPDVLAPEGGPAEAM